MQFFKIEMMCESQHQVTKFKSDFMKCFQSLFFHTNTCKRRKKIWKQGGGGKTNDKHHLYHPFNALSQYVQNCCFAMKRCTKSKEKPYTSPAEELCLCWYKQTHVGRQRMEKTGWNAGMPPWVALPIPRRKQPCPDTVRQKESSSSSSHPAAGDSCAILAGCRTTMPPSFQSFPNKRKHWLVNQTEGRREKDEGGGPVPLRFTLAHLHLLLFILNKYYSAKSQRT